MIVKLTAGSILGFSVIYFVHCLSNQEICTQCSELKEGSHVFQFCVNSNSSHTMLTSHSCCINKTSDYSYIVGLDWSDCNLTTIAGSLSGLTFLQELMLENNTEINFKSDDFDGLISLDYLSLPPDRRCPGGNNSWESMEKTKTATICLTELNLCDHHNMSCPNNNSHCVMTGPGAVQCICNDGFYGYKCLRQGHFPTVVYTTVLCVCTVVFSAFLWCTQRRKVIKVQ